MSNKIFINPSFKNIRQQLRSQMPKAEVILWRYIKSKQLKGYKFRRQHSIGKYIIDFYCPKLNLAIEIDGDSHLNNQSEKNDQIRQQYIESFGIKFFRFTNHQIYQDLDGVIEKISVFLP